MADINLSQLSVPELLTLGKDIEGEIQRRKVEDRKKVLTQMKELAASVGMTVEEVLSGSDDEKAKTKKQTEPKYRDPDNPKQSWGGKGPKPRWLNQALEAGAKLEDFEVR